MRRRQSVWVLIALIQVSLLAPWASGGLATAGEIATESATAMGSGCEHCPQCPGDHCPSGDCATPCSPAAPSFSVPFAAVFLTSLESVEADPRVPPSILDAPLHPPPIG